MCLSGRSLLNELMMHNSKSCDAMLPYMLCTKEIHGNRCLTVVLVRFNHLFQQVYNECLLCYKLFCLKDMLNFELNLYFPIVDFKVFHAQFSDKLMKLRYHRSLIVAIILAMYVKVFMLFCLCQCRLIFNSKGL